MFTQVQSNTYDLSTDEVYLHSGTSEWTGAQEKWATCSVKYNYARRVANISLQVDGKDPNLVVVRVTGKDYNTSSIIMKRDDLKKMVDFI